MRIFRHPIFVSRIAIVRSEIRGVFCALADRQTSLATPCSFTRTTVRIVPLQGAFGFESEKTHEGEQVIHGECYIAKTDTTQARVF